MKDLAAFEMGRAGKTGRTAPNPKKRQAGVNCEGQPGRSDPVYLDTPRSVLFKNIFEGSSEAPTLLTVVQKLYDLIEDSIKLPRKGADKINSLGSETAADIKTLAASALDLAEGNEEFRNLPRPRLNLLQDEADGQTVERALAGSNPFGCKVPEGLEKKLDAITESISRIQQAMTSAPPTRQNFNFAQPKQPSTTPSYALAASKHAPRAGAQRPPTTFNPVIHPKKAGSKPTPPSSLTRSQNSLTIVQEKQGGKELTSLTYPALIVKINNQLVASGIKENPQDTKTIQIRSVHRHPSNDIVLYTTTAKQAETLRATSQRWLPQVTQHMTLRNPVYPVVVHGIPTSFNPECPDHMAMLIAMNPDTLSPPPLFVKWISQQAIKRGFSHSSIRLGLSSIDQAKGAVDAMIFFGRYNKKTEYGRATKARCMNCLHEGHTSNYCKEQLMCPLCAEEHQADQCSLKGLLTTSCTACARYLKSKDPTVDLKLLFSKSPVGLRHSPLDPTCPTRIAKAVDLERQATAAREKEAAAQKTQQTRTVPGAAAQAQRTSKSAPIDLTAVLTPAAEDDADEGHAQDQENEEMADASC